MTSPAGCAEYELLDYNGTAFESCNVEMTQLSPMNYVDAGDPPMIVAHGYHDCSVPPQQSQLRVNRLTLHGALNMNMLLLQGPAITLRMWAPVLAMRNCRVFLMRIYGAVNVHKTAFF